jgi:GH15 family glucan-1,4-alpha-glucosidase
MASRIEDYGLIGNTRTSALVSRAGAIDWLCGPRFDSDAWFAALVGYDEHGRWAILPTVPVRETRQRYRDDTMTLETDFICDGGAVRVTDFMPVGEDRCDVVRIVHGLEGEVPVEMLLDVRFGYGHDTPWVTPTPDGVSFTAGPDTVLLRAPIPTRASGSRVLAYLRMKEGDRVPLQLTWHGSHERAPAPLDVEQALMSTEAFWRQWARRCTYEGRWRAPVMRSLLTLKALAYAPTGAVVAAPTTSLPEAIGGVRNWDYRFCWMRDASLTIDAFMIGGYMDEARAFRDWALRATAGDPAEMQIMYDITGARRLTEFELPWLPGYEGSRPVRVGNAASGQFQLDVYGEVLSCLYAGLKMGLSASEGGWQRLRRLLDFLERAWQREDDGIWEVRGGRRHFTHSKIMAWVAVDRAARAIEELGVGGDEGRVMLPHVHALRERIHAEVCERGFSPRIGAFTQSYGSDALDASMLLIPHFGFLPATDPRVTGTVAAIEKDLLRDGFVLRYNTETGADGLPGAEGAFLACSFWLADNYAFVGRIAEAEQLFERLLSVCNHVGLLAEEYEPKLRRQVGNFPQAFSHLALIVTANIIDAVSHGRMPWPPWRGEGAVRATPHQGADARAR